MNTLARTGKIDTLTCELCGATGGAEVILRLKRLILQCPVCGLVFSAPYDLQADGRSYSEAYYHNGVYADYLGERPAIERNASRTLLELRRLTSGRRLLEVGCAAGFSLAAAREAGWSVRGLELSAFMADYARRKLGLAVDTGSIETPPLGLPRSDVVTLWDTLEHLSHPAQALVKIRGLLHPGGLLALSTGDYGSLLRRLTGRHWRLFGDPTHNYFFDETTLRRLLERGGFRVLRLKRRGKWVSLSMILHQSGIPLATKVRQALQERGWNPPFYVNLRDVMTVYALASE